MRNAKIVQPATPDVHIDHRSGQLSVRTAAGPCRLAVIDSGGNIVPCEDIEDRIADAALDALFETIGPTLRAHSRRLEPPK